MFALPLAWFASKGGLVLFPRQRWPLLSMHGAVVAAPPPSTPCCGSRGSFPRFHGWLDVAHPSAPLRLYDLSIIADLRLVAGSDRPLYPMTTPSFIELTPLHMGCCC